MVVELSILFAFGAMLSWGIGDFLIQRSVKKIGTVEALAVIGVIGTLGLLPFVWKDIIVLFQSENAALVFWLGVITFIAAVLDFYALKIGKLSVIEFVLELELPITVLLGIFFFKEVLSTNQIAIICLAFIGIALISLRHFNIRASHLWEKGVLFAGASAIFMALVNFLTASAARGITPLLSIWAPWVVFTIISILYLHQQGKIIPFIKHARQHPSLILATGIIDTLAWVFFAFAVENHPLGITIAITESYPAVALYLGLHFNQEKIKIHQLAGAILAIGASVALGFWV